jgi:preprotein translocase subunit SecD
LETIRNRIDQFGVTEPLIQQQGKAEILVQLPGVTEPQRAMELIGRTALLEFRLLDENSPLASELPARVEIGKEEEAIKPFLGRLPADDEILFERITDETEKVTHKRPYLVKKTAALTGATLTDARVSIGDFNTPSVSIVFDAMGAKQFEAVTAANVQRQLAIVLDGTVYSAPTIQERIGGGRAVVSGTYTTEEANDLAIILRAGSLPAPVEIIQNVTVGPSLGRDSIDKGIRAGVIGTLLIVIFMVIYYRASGLLADFAMGLNIVLLIGALAALNATLTLPGIAGIILTIGMAVDSNVLIFERIRDELRTGKPVRLAIDAGYDKAFSSIFDSHVTALITSVVLFLFGTGPIKGFAVSLSLGIMINLFTSLVGTRVVFDWILQRRKLNRLSV